MCPPDPQSPASPVNIVKVGGSVLTLNDLPQRLQRVLDQLDGPSALVVGGGAAADAVRDWSSTFALDEPTAHWLAVDSLTLTARLVCELLNRSTASSAAVTYTWRESCAAVERGQIPILNPRSFLDALTDTRTVNEQEPPCLPQSWSATSDSIAAAIAVRWQADQLVLLKSVGPPDAVKDHAREAAPIDEWFINIAPQIPLVRWCNLRQSPLRLHDWRPWNSPISNPN